MEQLRQKSSALQEMNTKLRAERYSLINPETIDQQARELGLINANRMEVKIFDAEIAENKPSQNLIAQSTIQKKTLRE